MEIDVTEYDFFFVVSKDSLLKSEERGAHFIWLRELEHTGWILDDFFNQRHFVECFDSRLDQTCAFCIETKFVNKGLHMLHMQFLGFLRFLLLDEFFFSRFFKSIIIARVIS